VCFRLKTPYLHSMLVVSIPGKSSTGSCMSTGWSKDDTECRTDKHSDMAKIKQFLGLLSIFVAIDSLFRGIT
jgi:hypothetical protein